MRILFVFAWLDGGPGETEVRRLARSLDPARYRIDALRCLRLDHDPDPAPTSLTKVGINVDLTACDLNFEDTIRYLERKIDGCEIVVSCQNVADMYPAMERLHHRPPLIEYGRDIHEAQAGPKHLTTRYVGVSEPVRAAATCWMPDRPPLKTQLFRSFTQGGFECSTHRLSTGRRLDVIAAMAYDMQAENDYRQLGQMGQRTVRHGVRWHLVETQPGRDDFTSFSPMAQAAQHTGTQVIRDLLHYGWPDDIDSWTPAFVDRFADFARATAQRWREITDEVQFWCPINEISFFSWGDGDVRYLNPFATGCGFALQVQLARAGIAPCMRSAIQTPGPALYIANL